MIKEMCLFLYQQCLCVLSVPLLRQGHRDGSPQTVSCDWFQAHQFCCSFPVCLSAGLAPLHSTQQGSLELKGWGRQQSRRVSTRFPEEASPLSLYSNPVRCLGAQQSLCGSNRRAAAEVRTQWAGERLRSSRPAPPSKDLRAQHEPASQELSAARGQRGP